ncbi:LPXTG cell wall anchor domain-containing protein [Planococcus halotolerans]|uniref:LPXTG cell wall anchor domain-containing protein n=1 Tax=Planococcus halotolerans TaxID=2233542 RepID=UPI0010920DEC|nr:LPXTG cell wall anchor domain-containing protein [Planococcus halotolerans]QHJ70577.1 LPXTG cell wall anchor domain-containing protein [Planococcus halotolerans]
MLKKLVVAVLVLVTLTGLQIPVFAENHGEPPVKELEQQFYDLIYMETAENYEVEQYDSMAQLEEDMKSIMVWPLADHYLDTYFEERDGNVYLIPTEGPIRLNMDEDYTLEKISDEEYKLTQHGENALRGEYTLTITYSYEAGKWVFGNRMDIASSSDNGGEMPDTATSLPNAIAFGGALMAAGALVLISRRKRIA